MTTVVPFVKCHKVHSALWLHLFEQPAVPDSHRVPKGGRVSLKLLIACVTLVLQSQQICRKCMQAETRATSRPNLCKMKMVHELAQVGYALQCWGGFTAHSQA